MYAARPVYEGGPDVVTNVVVAEVEVLAPADWTGAAVVEPKRPYMVTSARTSEGNRHEAERARSG